MIPIEIRELDIRKGEAASDVIRFADDFEGGHICASRLVPSFGEKTVRLTIDGHQQVMVVSKDHAQRLKAALDKAIELGWLE